MGDFGRCNRNEDVGVPQDIIGGESDGLPSVRRPSCCYSGNILHESQARFIVRASPSKLWSAAL